MRRAEGARTKCDSWCVWMSANAGIKRDDKLMSGFALQFRPRRIAANMVEERPYRRRSSAQDTGPEAPRPASGYRTECYFSCRMRRRAIRREHHGDRHHVGRQSRRLAAAIAAKVNRCGKRACSDSLIAGSAAKCRWGRCPSWVCSSATSPGTSAHPRGSGLAR